MTLISHLGPALTVGSVVVEPEEPTQEPLRLTRGLMARARERMTTGDNTTPNALGQLVVAGVGGSCVLEVHVNGWYQRNATTGQTSLNPTAVAGMIDDLDWCQSLGILGLIRIFYGYYAPTWLKELAGGAMTWYTNDGSAGTGPAAPSNGDWRQMPNGMLRYTTTAAVDHYADFLSLLFGVPEIAGHPALAGVTVAQTMTQYTEVDIKQFALAENRNAILATMPGATTAEKAAAYNAADEAAQLAAFEAHREYVSPHGIASYTSYNGRNMLSSTGGMQTSWQQTVFYMEEQVRILGRMAVLENNSFRNPLFHQSQMYAHQLAQRDRTEPFPVPLHYQTQTNVKLEAAWDSQPTGGKITTPFSTIELALERRANSIELASGSEKASWTGTVGSSTQRWPAMTTTEAAAYNAAFRDVGLYV